MERTKTLETLDAIEKEIERLGRREMLAIRNLDERERYYRYNTQETLSPKVLDAIYEKGSNSPVARNLEQLYKNHNYSSLGLKNILSRVEKNISSLQADISDPSGLITLRMEAKLLTRLIRESEYPLDEKRRINSRIDKSYMILKKRKAALKGTKLKYYTHYYNLVVSLETYMNENSQKLSTRCLATNNPFGHGVTLEILEEISLDLPMDEEGWRSRLQLIEESNVAILEISEKWLHTGPGCINDRQVIYDDFLKGAKKKYNTELEYLQEEYTKYSKKKKAEHPQEKATEESQEEATEESQEEATEESQEEATEESQEEDMSTPTLPLFYRLKESIKRIFGYKP